MGTEKGKEPSKNLVGKNFLECLHIGQSIVVEVLDFGRRISSNRCTFVGVTKKFLCVRNKDGEFEIPIEAVFTVYIPQ
jgi:hypothetical protein